MSLYKQPVSDERIAFEAWYSASHTSVCLIRMRKGYISETTRVAWRAWQAASAVSSTAAQPRREPTVPATAYDRLFALNEANAARIIELEAAQAEQEPETCANCKHNEWPFGMCDGCPKQSDESQTGNWEAKSKQADSLSPALPDADMDKLATAVNQIDAGEKGWHHLMDVALSIAQQPAQQEPVAWCPDVCPITGLPFFMWIEHHETGQNVPTYGGPYDSYTIPVRDKDGSYCRERYDHDRGGWLTDAVEDVGIQIVSDQAYVSDDEPPAQRKPLTDEQIGEFYYGITHQRWSSNGSWLKTFARAIEAAHNITGEKK